YIAQAAWTAEALGVLRAPRTVDELRSTLATYRPELRSTEGARDVARFLLWQAPVPWVARPGYVTLALSAAATLPEWALRLLGIPRVPVVGPIIGDVTGSGVVRAIRWIMSAPPRDERDAALQSARAARDPE